MGICLSDLNLQTQQWRIPQAHVTEAKKTVTKLEGRTPSDPQVGLADQVAVFSPPDQTPTGESSQKRSGRRLNPAFVSWLMGMPWFWTRAEPTSFGAQATASWRYALQQHLSNLLRGQGFSPAIETESTTTP